MRTARDANAGRHVQIAVHVQSHAVAPPAGREVVDHAMPGRVAAIVQVERPDLSIAAGHRTAIDHVHAAAVLGDGDAVGALDVGNDSH